MTSTLHLVALTVGGPHLDDIGTRVGWGLITVQLTPLQPGTTAATVGYQPIGRGCFPDTDPGTVVAAGGHLIDLAIPDGDPTTWTTDQAVTLLGAPPFETLDCTDPDHPWEPVDTGPTSLHEILDDITPGLAANTQLRAAVHYAQYQ